MTKNNIFLIALLALLPILGEYSRVTLFGRELLLADIILPTLLPYFLYLAFKSKQHFSLLLIILGFALVGTLSLLFSLFELPLNAALNSSLFLVRFISYSLLIFLALHQSSNENSWRAIFQVILISTFILSLTGFIQLALMPDLETLAQTAGYDPHIDRLVGSWLDPNFIGGLFAMIITLTSPFLIDAFSQFKQKKDQQKITLKTQLGLLILTGTLLTALFLTYSRSAYLALVTGLIIVGLLKSRQMILVIILIATIGISVSPRSQQRLGELVTSVTSTLFNSSENPDPTARLRIKSWEQTLSLISEKPLLGHGYNTLAQIKQNRGFVSSTDIHSASGSDSSLLTILATTGIIGLGVYFSIQLYLLFSAWQAYKNKKHQISNFGLGYLGLFFALQIHSLFVNSQLFPQTMIYFWLISGLLLQLSKTSQLPLPHSYSRLDKASAPTDK